MKKKIFYSLLICAASSVYAQTGNEISGKYTKLVFQDEFNGTGLPDKSKWDFEKMKLGIVGNCPFYIVIILNKPSYY